MDPAAWRQAERGAAVKATDSCPSSHGHPGRTDGYPARTGQLLMDGVAQSQPAKRLLP